MELIVSLVILIVQLALIARYKENFIYLYIIISVLIDVFLGFFNLETNMIAYSRAIVGLVYVYVVYEATKFKLFRSTPIFLFYFLFIIILSFFSSKFNSSISGVVKMILIFSMFPLGVVYFNDYEKLLKLNRAVIWIMGIITINFVISNIFGLGSNPYGDQVEFFVGNLKLSAINTPVYTLLIMTSILQLNRKKERIVAVLFAIPTFIFLLLSMKRISLLALALGLIIILYYSKYRAKYLKWLFIAGILIISLAPFYLNVLNQQLDARNKQLTIDVLETESRYLETFEVWDRIFQTDQIEVALFGKQVFNSATYYGRSDNRPLHVDYNVLLLGTGIFGMALYFLIYFRFIKLMNKVSKFTSTSKVSISHNKYYRILKPLFYAILFSTLLISLSGGLLGITHRSLAFLYMGAIVGVLNPRNRS